MKVILFAASALLSAAGKKPLIEGYDFVNMTGFLIAVYAVSFGLNEGKIISLRAHRRVWNAMLLFTFLVCAIIGILLVLRINYGIVVQLPFNMLYWHVEAGIAMTVISVFHILWHRDYFACELENALGRRKEPDRPRPGRKRLFKPLA